MTIKNICWEVRPYAVTSTHVIIAGAGIGGLTAALALLKSGIDCDLYEQASELREVGAGLQLAPNGTRVLFALGLEPRCAARASRPATRRSGSGAPARPGRCSIRR